jgi:hypothetical protein
MKKGAPKGRLGRLGSRGGYHGSSFAPIIIVSIVGIFLIRGCMKDDNKVLSKSLETTNKAMQLLTFQTDDT